MYKKVGAKSLGSTGLCGQDKRAEGELFFMTCDSRGNISGGSLPNYKVRARKEWGGRVYIFDTPVKFELKGKLV